MGTLEELVLFGSSLALVTSGGAIIGTAYEYFLQQRDYPDFRSSGTTILTFACMGALAVATLAGYYGIPALFKHRGEERK